MPPGRRPAALLAASLAAALSLAPSAAQFASLVGDALALANTSKPGDGFSVQDKLLPCNGGLVLVDLDSDVAANNCVPPACPPPATLQQCSTSAAARRIQQWTRRAAGPGLALAQISLAAPPPYFFVGDGTCLDQGGAFVGSFAYGWHCRNPTDPAHSNQWWTISADGRLYSNATAPKYVAGLCLTAGSPGVAPLLEVELTMQPCDGADDAQAFAFSEADGTLRHVSTGLCVDAGVIGRTVTWDGEAWSSRRIIPHACPDAGNPALLPRDRVGTYTVGRTKIGGDPTKGDRLIVIGGDDASNNVYVSDNCGADWTCFDGDQPWTVFGMSFAPVLTLDALPGAPLIMAGGLANSVGGGAAPSSALYYALDGGAGTWLRGYDLPFAGVFPGAIAQDRSSVYVFGGAASGFAVWSVDESNYNTSGFAQIPGSAFAQGADVGRREYVRGTRSGGCWVASDFSPGDLWAAQRTSGAPIASSNAVFVARAATGPWARFTAPWAPRASAAVVLSKDGTQVFVAGGVGFAGGAPTGESFSDVWVVDARVCLLASNGAVCGGHGAANLSDVSCSCDAAWSGDDRCGSCTMGAFGPTCDGTCPSGSGGGGFCNAGRGFGVCDPVSGCVCTGNHVDGPGRACDGCASLSWGAACSACPACNPAHTVGGACDGSGTTGGTGTCVCAAGFVGPLCADAAPSASPSSAPASGAASAATENASGPGAIAAGVLVPLAVLAAGAVTLSRRLARVGSAANPPLLRSAAAGSPVRNLAAVVVPPAGASERAALLNAARGSAR